MKAFKDIFHHEFQSNSTSGTQYGYDGNGSLIWDANKQIAHIAYDNLNYPKEVQFTSGYRCEAVNKMVGGVSTSQHLRGEAVDFTLILPQNHEPLTLNHDPLTMNHEPLTLHHPPLTLRQVFDWMAANVPYDQLIWEYGRWIHVSLHIDPRLNRHQVIEYR